MVNLTTADSGSASANELHAGQTIAGNVAIHNCSAAMIVHHNAEHLAIANTGTVDNRIAARADEHAGHAVADDLAFFHRSAALVPEDDAAGSAVVKATTADSCFRPGAM